VSLVFDSKKKGWRRKKPPNRKEEAKKGTSREGRSQGKKTVFNGPAKRFPPGGRKNHYHPEFMGERRRVRLSAEGLGNSQNFYEKESSREEQIGRSTKGRGRNRGGNS